MSNVEPSPSPDKTEKHPNWYVASVKTVSGVLLCPDCDSPRIWSGMVTSEDGEPFRNGCGDRFNRTVIIDFRCEDCGLEPELILYETGGRTRLQWFNR